MSSKGKIYLIIVIIFCLTLIVSGLRNIEDERTKTLEHIIFLPASSKLLFEYNNNSQSIINSPFNQTFPIISENDLIVNDKNIYKIKEGREIEKTNSLEGTVYYYKDSVNYMLNSNQKYLKVLSDNSVNYYYLFDDNLNSLNCRQVIEYKGSILCLNTNLGTVYKLEKSLPALKYDEFNKSEYVIIGIFNSEDNPLIIYQPFSSGEQGGLNTILRINDKDVSISNDFVYQVAYRDGNYIVSTISESNLNNNINSYQILKLSPQGEIENISNNASGVVIY